MKILKIILIAIFVIIAIPLVVAIFVEKDYAVEREIVIDRPKSDVFDYIKYLKNQNHYAKWNSVDPDMKQTYTGIDGEVGFVSAWESDNPEVGKGEQEIVKIEDGKRVDTELRFLEPFESTEPAYMTVESEGANKTSVKWGFSGHMDYPMNMMLLFVDFEEVIGNDFDEGLRNLKGILEE